MLPVIAKAKAVAHFFLFSLSIISILLNSLIKSSFFFEFKVEESVRIAFTLSAS